MSASPRCCGAAPPATRCPAPAPAAFARTWRDYVTPPRAAAAYGQPRRDCVTAAPSSLLHEAAPGAFLSQPGPRVLHMGCLVTDFLAAGLFPAASRRPRRVFVTSHVAYLRQGQCYAVLKPPISANLATRRPFCSSGTVAACLQQRDDCDRATRQRPACSTATAAARRRDGDLHNAHEKSPVSEALTFYGAGERT